MLYFSLSQHEMAFLEYMKSKDDHDILNLITIIEKYHSLLLRYRTLIPQKDPIKINEFSFGFQDFEITKTEESLKNEFKATEDDKFIYEGIIKTNIDGKVKIELTPYFLESTKHQYNESELEEDQEYFDRQKILSEPEFIISVGLDNNTPSIQIRRFDIDQMLNLTIHQEHIEIQQSNCNIHIKQNQQQDKFENVQTFDFDNTEDFDLPF